MSFTTRISVCLSRSCVTAKRFTTGLLEYALHHMPGIWSQSRRLGLETVSRRTNVSSRSRLFTSRAQDVIFDQIMQAKFFDFVSSLRSTSVPSTTEQLTFADIKQQYTLYLSEVSGRGLDVLNERRFCALRPLARKIFTVPASSAASERVFNRAGLIMCSTRSRLSKANLSKLVFLNCNDKLQL